MALLALLLPIATLGLIMIGGIWGMNVAAARMVGDKHRMLQTIVETGEVPESWRRPYEVRIARMRGRPDRRDRLARVQNRAQRHYLRELDRLVRYVRKTTLVEDEDVRQTLLESLADTRAKWRAEATTEESH